MVGGPKFVQFFGSVLDALKNLGGSARPGEVEEWVAHELQISAEVQDELTGGGQPRFRNQLHWARFYLAQAGLLDSSKRGVWTLTDKGWSTSLTPSQSLKVFKNVRAGFKKPDSKRDPEIDTKAETEEDEPVEDYKVRLLKLLKQLPPDGFERLCQRLLRESGFENVNVTGRSGDGGIDGHGILRVNPLVSFYVYFQCKRYSHPVGPGVVRDFRGAMIGRADKGIIVT